MSHHVDTAIARKDGRLNIGDLYVFEGTNHETTLFVMTVNPDAGRSSPTTFHPEAMYTFNIDNNGDAVEDLSYQVIFGESDADSQQHVQLRRIERPVVERGTATPVLAEGQTNSIISLPGGGRMWAGLAGDPFFADGTALNQFVKMVSTQNTFDVSVFEKGHNLFAQRNITGIVLEIPNAVLGQAALGVWATTTLMSHGASAQINRWSMPLLTHLFLPDEQSKDAFNAGQPKNDKIRLSAAIASTVTRITALAGTTANPEAYGQQVAALLLPAMLHYHPGTPASYGFAGQNGRTLTDDVMDVMLSLVANQPISDHVHSMKDTREDFPFLAPPYALSETQPPLNPEAQKK